MKRMFVSAALAFVLGTAGALITHVAKSADIQKTDIQSPAVVRDNQSGVAGVDDSQAIANFLTRLQNAMNVNDRKAVAGMIAYPLKIYSNGAMTQEYKNADAVVSGFDGVFTEAVKKAIGDASIDKLVANDQGVMIGSGEIWFDGNDGTMKIRTINPQAAATPDAAAVTPAL